jgi:ubiquinol-cytochrome c reductase cytochrome b subunit
VVVWVGTVFAFGAADRIFLALQISYTAQLWIFRVLFFVAPVVAYVVARRWAEELRRTDAHPLRGVQAEILTSRASHPAEREG